MLRGNALRWCLRGRITYGDLYAIYIGRLYTIHGTNANFGIGLRVSQGCIRLRNDDIKYLFDHVPVGTRSDYRAGPLNFG